MFFFILNAIRSVFEREPEIDADEFVEPAEIEEEGRGDKINRSIDLESLRQKSLQRKTDYPYELEDDWEK
ncbi:MAG: hypothetical protein JKY50_01160 [Oleispira sp.]|nr:hypothetical protein [Oleispira sp.]